MQNKHAMWFNYTPFNLHIYWCRPCMYFYDPYFYSCTRFSLDTGVIHIDYQWSTWSDLNSKNLALISGICYDITAQCTEMSWTEYSILWCTSDSQDVVFQFAFLMTSLAYCCSIHTLCTLLKFHNISLMNLKMKCYIAFWILKLSLKINIVIEEGERVD